VHSSGGVHSACQVCRHLCAENRRYLYHLQSVARILMRYTGGVYVLRSHVTCVFDSSSIPPHLVLMDSAHVSHFQS